jgi:23S rRNA maturation-related 3'-5' exoribonuclease YhaM
MIKDLKANALINDKFLIDRINQGLASNGTTYLTLSLKDKTGNVDAKL